MKKAINAWSVPDSVTFEGMFADLSAAGFEGVELNIDRDGASAHSLAMDSGSELYSRISRLSERYGLPVCSISTSLYGASLGSGDPAEREKGKKLLLKQLECAQALSAGAILAVPGGIGGDTSIRKAYGNVRRSLSELSAEIVRADICVGLENVWNGFFASPFDMARLIDEVGIPRVGAYFDAGNVAILSRPEDWIEILGGRIVSVHVKDFARQGGYRGNFANLLEGDIRWDRVTAALADAGYDGYLTAELPAMPRTPAYLYETTSRAMDIMLNRKEAVS